MFVAAGVVYVSEKVADEFLCCFNDSVQPENQNVKAEDPLL